MIKLGEIANTLIDDEGKEWGCLMMRDRLYPDGRVEKIYATRNSMIVKTDKDNNIIGKLHLKDIEKLIQ